MQQTSDTGPTPDSDSASRGIDAVAEQARDRAPDAHFAALLAPRRTRPLLMALAAYEGDLERIPETVSEPMLGEIRLQWWRDTLGDRAAPPAHDALERTGHPVADVLRAGIAAGVLNRARLVAMADTRAFDLSGGRITDMKALDVHLEKGVGGGFCVAMEALSGRGRAAGAPLLAAREEAARHAGIAYGLARLIARFPRSVALGADPIPPELLGPGLAAPLSDLRPALDHLGERARVALREARQAAREVPGNERLALLRLALVEPLLKVALDPARDPTREVAVLNPATRAWRLAGARLFGA